MGRVLSVDIGSTWTKAAVLELAGDASSVIEQAEVPTTQEDLSCGFAMLLRRLLHIPEDAPLERIRPGIPVYVSSSAKGGLSIAAIGVVPELTVSVARLAAASAGGRITAHYAYGLSSAQVLELEAAHPDIVLLCGGTDGGNESYVLRNARALASSSLEAVILYAGNAALADQVRSLLGGKRLVVTENAMPGVGVLNIEPARAAIRTVFLERIVGGRGLEKVRGLCAAEPKPTPLAVYELVQAVGGGDWLLIDMGGATTDVYSHCPAFRGEEGTVLRGLEEPVLMRTVEGDLGMRVSAEAAAEIGRGYIRRRLAEENVPADCFASWVKRAAATPTVLSCSGEEGVCDGILAEACLYHALMRHAGTVEETWTPGGKVRVQRGKDLRLVRWIAASGGWLARCASPAPLLRALAAARGDSGGRSLLPAAPSILADSRHIVPVLGNVAAIHPQGAAALAERILEIPDGG